MILKADCSVENLHIPLDDNGRFTPPQIISRPSGLIVDCVPTFTQGVVLQDESFRMNPWALVLRAPGAGSRLYRALKGFTLKGII